MKKIIIFILITVLMLLSCKNNSTNADTSQDNNNENSGNNNNNGNNGGSTVTPEELEKYGIDIASATTQTIEEALIKYEADHKGEYKLIFKGNSTAQYDGSFGNSIAGFLNAISLKTISVIVSLEYVDFPNNKLNDYIFGGSQNYNYNIVKVILPDTITTIGKDAFMCGNLTNVNIPKNLKTIEDEAFYEMKMEELILPDGLTTIGKYAFRICTFTNVVIPDSVTSIGEQAFESCKKITKVKLPNNLTTLEPDIFASCYELKSITIPASVTEIKKAAFYSCGSLDNITFLSANPPIIGDYVFYGTALKTIYVPQGSLSKYKALKGNGIPDNVNIIEK
ncbi:leucine-rich repeat domain-containing protein [Brachyspira pilosicoli]|uniref:leucine-rich repeat domain-containing protein n=1 Tax=Brachyspira pilosicoli TaxID=52584 RepID=UPI0012F4C96D|nr:leucine-rich repeat domain-containing protein [Brachyspira pilosicoli]